MAAELYYDHFSQPCRAIWIFLKAAEIPFEPKPIELKDRDHHTAEYTQKSPKNQVPILDDNGFILSESTTMVSYLAQKYQVAEHWYPRSDLQRQAKVDEFLHWHQLTIRKHESAIFLNVFTSRLPCGKYPMKPLDQGLVDSLKAELGTALQFVEDYFLKDNQFIGGDEISAADIFGVCELQQLECVGEEAVYESRPKIKAWADRVKEQLKPYYEEAAAKFHLLGEGFKAAA